jgi:hypothetical protein
VDSGQAGAHIGLEPHSIELGVAGRCGREACLPNDPAQESGIVDRCVLRALPESLAHESDSLLLVAPAGHQALEALFFLGFAQAPREVRGLPERDRAVQAKGERAVGVSRGEDGGKLWSARSTAEDGGALHPGGVHHRPDVVHLNVKSGRPTQPVGHADAALVEMQDTHVAGEPAHEACEARLLPVQLEVGDPAEDHDQGNRSRAEVLVGDAGAIHGPGPAGLGNRPPHCTPFSAWRVDAISRPTNRSTLSFT